mgnify:CR=1 FL=1
MYHSRLYAAANYAKANKQLEVIQLNLSVADWMLLQLIQ